MNKLISITVSIFLILFILLSSVSFSFAILGEQGSDKMMEEYQSMTKIGKSDSILKNLLDGFSFFINSTINFFNDCKKNSAKTDKAFYGSSDPEDMQQIFTEVITGKNNKVNIDAKGVAMTTSEVNFSAAEAEDTNDNKINDFEKQKAIYRNYIEHLKDDN